MRRNRYHNIVIPVVIAFAVFFCFLAVRGLLDRRGNRDVYELYDGETVRLVIGARLLSLKNPPIIRDNEIALDLDTVRRYLDGTVDWDQKNRKVTVTTRDRLVRMNTDDLTAFVNDKEVKLELPVFEEDGLIYLPMKFLSGFYQINVFYHEGNKVVIIDERTSVIQTASVVAAGAVIRLGRSVQEPVVKRFEGPVRPAEATGSDASADGERTTGADGESTEDGAEDLSATAETDGAAFASVDDFDMYVFEDYDDWYKVRALDGVIGYIEKKYVAVRRYVDRVALDERRDAVWRPENGKINMVWEQVSSARANPDVSKIPEMPGLDVVSPTWFVLTDSGGTVESRASAAYIEWAHNRGYKVWALFANTMNDIDMTSAFLRDSLSRENAIRSLLVYAEMLGLDGLNLDFENVYLKDRDALTQFVRELAPMLREQGLTFSVDVNVPDGSDTWSRCYDTAAIALAADYVNLMAYDQHVASGGMAGSVSQLSWVERNLTKLIERDGVPPEKMILGMPFYTRVWEMERVGSPPGGAIADSQAVGMKTAISAVFDNNAKIEWSEESGQFYCEYQKAGKSYHVWIEDENSINLRSSLVHKYALAGVSAWSRTFAVPGIWDVLNRNLKGITTYYEWQSEASETAPELARVPE